MILLLLLSVLVHSAAHAAVVLLTPDGPLLPGQENHLVVVLHHEGRTLTETVPALGAKPGDVYPAEGRVRDGVYAYRYVAPPELPPHVVFTVGTGGGGITRISLPTAPIPEPLLQGPRGGLDVRAGGERTVEIPFSAEDLPFPEQIQLTATEGTVGIARREEDELVVRFTPGEERFPRVAVVGIRDRRYPGTPPTWIPVRVWGHPRIPVKTEPGALVTLEVGGRSFGPFEADAGGRAVARIPVPPGEETARVHIEDALGNVQQTTLNLVRESTPTLAWMAEPVRAGGSMPAMLHLAAFDPSGQPWRGDPPRCRMSPGGHVEPVMVGPGRYRVAPTRADAEDFLDLKATCVLPDAGARVQTRLPVGEGVPHRLVLRVYPEALSADFPVGQVQVFLEDRQGDRLPPHNIELGADHGTLEMEGKEARSLRAEYNGAAAASYGEDRLWARYLLPEGNGIPHRLQVAHGAVTTDRTSLVVYGRATDAAGRPLSGVVLMLDAGGTARGATTNERGWAEALVPYDPEAEVLLLRARSGSLVHRWPYLPQDPGPAADIDAPDLKAVLKVPITAGRVREVFLSTDPSVVQTNPAESSRVTVRLVDRDGNAVRDKSLEVRASQGEVTRLKTRADGTYEAWFHPPAGLLSGTVTLTATGREGAFAASTDIQLEPRPLSYAAGLGIGGLHNLGAISSILGELFVEARTPLLRRRLVLRLSGSAFGDTQELDDGNVTTDTTWYPVTLSALVRQERGLRTSWVGAGFLGLGYHHHIDYGGQVADEVDDTGITGPGVALFGGLGLRFALGELGLEFRYLQLPSDFGVVKYEGNVGGLAPRLQYRILF